MIVCLHGFLGQPDDWQFLAASGFEVSAPNLFRGDRIPNEGDVLLGYSMGGRLALESLLAGARYSRAVIISAGLNLERGREERQSRDEEWAQRFESEDWDALMEAWNAQPVLSGTVVERREADFSRAMLARALREWSPGTLAPLAPRLGKLTIPILWVAGERDTPYVEEGKRAVSLLPHGELWICPDAGHRIPWERPQGLIDRLRRFLE
ncbi:MAG TPA: alpha/beta fold hydrolase [Thermoanaerobaculia bacterium]|nr:alpha/beta fold hydrolase [Thermoanaerobaculia bacterium]